MYYLVHMNLINLTTILTSLDIMTIFLIDAEAIWTQLPFDTWKQF